MKQKKKLILIGLIIAVAAVFFAAAYFSRKSAPVETEHKKQTPEVSVQSVSASREYAQVVQYPATVVADQEIQVTAKSAGTATAVNFDLGDQVGVGALLVRIDDVGNRQKIGDSGFKSSEVQQSRLSVEQAEEQLELAEKTHENLKDAYDDQKKDPSLSQTVTKTQVDAAKDAIEIAEIQLKNAKVGYKGTLDDHLITNPIGGYVTRKSVAAGDSVSVGQLLFAISKTAKIKVQFFVDEKQLSFVKPGLEINMTDSSGKEATLVVRNISPEADAATKRFLIEAFPKNTGSTSLLSGTIVSVSFSAKKTPSEEGDLILPLSAINIGQNENYIFIAENGPPNGEIKKAKKIGVSILNVDGETADIKADIAPEAKIIISGSKLVQDGQEIKIVD